MGSRSRYGFLLLILCVISTTLLSQTKLKLEGQYHHPLYIQNPFSDQSTFCIDSIIVNDLRFPITDTASAIKVDLSKIGIDSGSSINILIFHKSNCTPRILNPYPIPRREFDVDTFFIDTDTVLNIRINSYQPYILKVEHYRWNQWVPIKNTYLHKDTLMYKIDLKKSLHSGENKLRIKVDDPSRANRKISEYLTPPILTTSNRPKPNYEFDKKLRKITFTSTTNYRVYDIYGNLVKLGRSTEIDCSDIHKGKYILQYDNVQETIKIPRK